MSGTWENAGREALLCLRGKAAGWGYRSGSDPAVEPTVLSCLALLATDTAGDATDVVRASADWLAAVQNRDGSLGITAVVPAPGWTTAYGLLLWAALGGYEAQRERAARWALGLKGLSIPIPPPAERVNGHDTTLVGWPWVSDTHSWLEPTALTALALGRDAYGDHPRVREALRVVRDRAIPSGGWNYGNNIVFGRELRPQPSPTGLALMALAREGGRTGDIDRAVGYLREALPATRAAQSLGWGLLGLRAWGGVPRDADGWLAGSCAQALRRPDSAVRLACLLLAAGGRSLELFGVLPQGEVRREG